MNRPHHSPRVLRSVAFAADVLQIAALMVAFERPAHAYVDPGSGFVFLQVAGSMFAGAIFYLRHRVKRLLYSLRRSPGPSADRGCREPAMSQGTSQHIATFRDPAGSLRIHGEDVLRTVHPRYAAESLRFLQSDLARRWTEEGHLVASEVLSAEEDQPLLLQHPRVFFPSYPWEWTPSQWVAAGELTLELCGQLLHEGWILKDATPLNILFDGSRPVFVDLLSIERRDPRSPLWLAYGQFARTFLLPLAAYKYLGWPLAATLHRRDGYEPADLTRTFPVSSDGALRFARWSPFLSCSRPASVVRERRPDCSRSRKSRLRCWSETSEDFAKPCARWSRKDAIRAGANTMPLPITTAKRNGGASRNSSTAPCNRCAPNRCSTSAAIPVSTRALPPVRALASSPGTRMSPHPTATGEKPGRRPAHSSPGR